MVVSKLLIYVIGGLLGLTIASTVVTNVKSYFKEPTYTKEAVELMLKHSQLREEIKSLKIENQVIEKDNERLKSDISSDSLTIHNSSRAYRDSLRAELFR